MMQTNDKNLKKSLKMLGNAMLKISDKFVEDYTPLVNESKIKFIRHCLRNLKTIFQEILNDFLPRHVSDNQFMFASLPNDNDLIVQLNVYPKNWEEIARCLKEKYNYICQECHRNFSDCKHLLHVHHKNGLKNDCIESNLEVLCRDCHQKKHHHKIG